jgi:hypothetical protein
LAQRSSPTGGDAYGMPRKTRDVIGDGPFCAGKRSGAWQQRSSSSSSSPHQCDDLAQYGAVLRVHQHCAPREAPPSTRWWLWRRARLRDDDAAAETARQRAARKAVAAISSPDRRQTEWLRPNRKLDRHRLTAGTRPTTHSALDRPRQWRLASGGTCCRRPSPACSGRSRCPRPRVCPHAAQVCLANPARLTKIAAGRPAGQRRSAHRRRSLAAQ